MGKPQYTRVSEAYEILLLKFWFFVLRTEPIMDHAVKASRSHPWNKLRFENDELEELYQRYTLKIQWVSVLGVVTLVVILTGIMAILSLSYNQAATIHVIILPYILVLLIKLRLLSISRTSSMDVFVFYAQLYYSC